jgi:hypothetical protein
MGGWVRFFVIALLGSAAGCGGTSVRHDAGQEPAATPEHCTFTLAEQCVNVWVNNHAAPRLAVADQYLYFTDLSGTVSRVDSHSGAVETLAHVDRATGLAVDATELYVQIAGVSGQSNAGVASLSKTGGEPQSVLQGYDETLSIAVSDGLLLTGERLSGVIRQTPVGGGTTGPLVTADGQVLGIAARDGELYWNEWDGSDARRVMRLEFGSDGSVSETVATDDGGPPLLADGAAYWVNDLSGNVWRAAQHGGTPELVFTTVADTVHRSVGLAVGGGYVYVLTSDRRLVRAAIGSWQVEQLLANDLLGGLAADDEYLYFELDGVGIFRMAHVAP